MKSVVKMIRRILNTISWLKTKKKKRKNTGMTELLEFHVSN